MTHHKDFLHSLFTCAVQSVHPSDCLADHLPTDRIEGRTIILAAGKAAAAMAKVAAETLGGNLTGLAVTRHGHLAPDMPENIEVIEAGHPIPDDMSRLVAPRMMALAEAASNDDRIIMLVSGGASALLSAPVDEITFRDKQKVTKFLLHSGATISEINCVRKHLSKIKGGRLARAAAPVEVYSFLISDVPGDLPEDIASGPTVADTTCLSDAENILNKYGWKDEGCILTALKNPANESLFPNDRIFERCHTKIVARAADALLAAADLAKENGWQTVILGDDLEGIADQVGREHAALARSYKQKSGRWAILSGGETTVEVKNPNGRGGRNLEYLAGLAIGLDGHAGISALACDTDGIDGTEDVAGAFIGEDFMEKCRNIGISPAEYLSQNNTYGLFEKLGCLVKTGPTLTNVNDFRVILIEGE